MSSAFLNLAAALISIVFPQLDNTAFQIPARMEEPAFQKKMDTDARVSAILKEMIVKVSCTTKLNLDSAAYRNWHLSSQVQYWHWQYLLLKSNRETYMPI